ncbi:MAG: ABC transporter ATP-binding protein [Clostridiales bacterium]|nr:ABC transporter ATP-binding protein [bacterium 210917-SL.2.15]MCI5842148.1 ABC transporter ATP-binding protein [Clostridiales bacterium]MDY4037228.1 ABC transporter ATP-binding protein [Candidatus Pseudoscilispira sp.]
MEHNAIELSELTKRYAGFTLGPIDLTLPGGAILGLIGENGAGKTTLMKTMLGVTRPDGGTVRLLGQEAEQAKADIGVVLEDCFFYEGLRPRDVGRVLGGVYPTWDGALFEAYLKKFGLADQKSIKALSRGMRMKLSLAAALAHRPKLLLLDEATAGLDPVVRDEILDEFLDFACDEQHSILISSHITSDLEKAADYIAYLHQGKLLLCEEKDCLLEKYGRLACSEAELSAVDASLLVGVRRGRFSCEALVKNRALFAAAYPHLAVEGVGLDDIMVFINRAEKEREAEV